MSAVADRCMEVCVGSLDDIPPGQGRAYRVGTDEIAVFRRRDGRIFALDNRCPHRGGPLADGLVGGDEVICPLHSWRFDLASGRGLTDPCGVRGHSVRVEHGRVYLRVGDQNAEPVGAGSTMDPHTERTVVVDAGLVVTRAEP